MQVSSTCDLRPSLFHRACIGPIDSAVKEVSTESDAISASLRVFGPDFLLPLPVLASNLKACSRPSFLFFAFLYFSFLGFTSYQPTRELVEANEVFFLFFFFSSSIGLENIGRYRTEREPRYRNTSVELNIFVTARGPEARRCRR